MPKTSAGGQASGDRASGAAARDSGAAARAANGSRGSARTRGRARGDVPPPSKAERNLRTAVTRLWACSYAISPTQRRVLQRRAGLDGDAPTSVRGTARALDLSRRAVRRAERAGVRALRRANRSDGCAMGAGTAPDTRAIVAVATAPALRTVTDMDGQLAARRPDTARRDQGGVLGQRASSAPRPAAADRAPRRTAAQLSASSDEGVPVLPLLILLLAIAGMAFLVLRPEREVEIAGDTLVATRLPRARAEPEPSRSPSRARARARAEPDHPTPALARRRPGPGRPAPRRTAPEPPADEHEARRLAGLAASGLASVAIGVLLRARRRR